MSASPRTKRSEHCWHWTTRGGLTMGTTTDAEVRCCWCGHRASEVTRESAVPAQGHGRYGPRARTTEYTDVSPCTGHRTRSDAVEVPGIYSEDAK